MLIFLIWEKNYWESIKEYLSGTYQLLTQSPATQEFLKRATEQAIQQSPQTEKEQFVRSLRCFFDAPNVVLQVVGLPYVPPIYPLTSIDDLNSTKSAEDIKIMEAVSFGVLAALGFDFIPDKAQPEYLFKQLATGFDGPEKLSREYGGELPWHNDGSLNNKQWSYLTFTLLQADVELPTLYCPCSQVTKLLSPATIDVLSRPSFHCVENGQSLNKASFPVLQSFSDGNMSIRWWGGGDVGNLCDNIKIESVTGSQDEVDALSELRKMLQKIDAEKQYIQVHHDKGVLSVIPNGHHISNGLHRRGEVVGDNAPRRILRAVVELNQAANCDALIGKWINTPEMCSGNRALSQVAETKSVLNSNYSKTEYEKLDSVRDHHRLDRPDSIRVLEIRQPALEIVDFVDFDHLCQFLKDCSGLVRLTLSDRLIRQDGIAYSHFRMEKLLSTLGGIDSLSQVRVLTDDICDDLEGVDEFHQFIDRLKQIYSCSVGPSVTHDVSQLLALTYEGRNIKGRYLEIDLNVIDSIISARNGAFSEYFSDIKPGQDGVYAMPKSDFTESVFQDVLAVNRGVDEYYLTLSHCLAMIGFNMNDTAVNRKYHVAATYLYASHWIIDDIVDKNKSSAVGQRFLNAVLPLYLSAFSRPESEADSSIANVYDLNAVVSDPKLIKKLEKAIAGLEVSVKLLRELLIPSALKIIEEHFTNAVMIFCTKLELTVEERSLQRYTKNRSLSAGCIPYMNLKYFAYAQEAGLNQNTLVDLIRRCPEIKLNEVQADIFNGFVDDSMTLKKDFHDEKIASLVPVVSNANRRLGFYESATMSMGYCRRVYHDLSRDVALLFQRSHSSDHPYHRVIAQGLFQDMFGIVLFHFHFHGRYETDFALVNIMNYKNLLPEQKKERYNMTGYSLIPGFRTTLRLCEYDIYKTIDFAFYGPKELTTKESDSQQDEDVETAAFSLALMRQGMFRDPGAFGRLISANMPVCACK